MACILEGKKGQAAAGARAGMKAYGVVLRAKLEYAKGRHLR